MFWTPNAYTMEKCMMTVSQRQRMAAIGRRSHENSRVKLPSSARKRRAAMMRTHGSRSTGRVVPTWRRPGPTGMRGEGLKERP